MDGEGVRRRGPEARREGRRLGREKKKKKKEDRSADREWWNGVVKHALSSQTRMGKPHTHQARVKDGAYGRTEETLK